MPSLVSLHLYPVKSCRGLDVAQATLTDAGLEHDREWMIVTPEGRFVTQREEPRLARIAVGLGESALELSVEGAGGVAVPCDFTGRAVEVVVWGDRVAAIDQGDAAAAWLTGLLGRELRLVRFAPAARRRSDPGWTGGHEAWTRFSDGFALLAISTASLDDLNRRLPSPVPMNRFRPNLVLDGLPPYGEDALDELASADGCVRLRVVKPCTRCRITTTDQRSGEVDAGEEPLRTLRGYRWNAALRGIAFGQNLIVAAGAGATLRAGQELRTSARSSV